LKKRDLKTEGIDKWKTKNLKIEEVNGRQGVIVPYIEEKRDFTRSIEKTLADFGIMLTLAGSIPKKKHSANGYHVVDSL
jgi:hypothetical protein